MKKYLLSSFAIFTMLFTSLSLASPLYRMMSDTYPLKVNLHNSDVLIISYDFSHKKALRCSANKANLQVSYTYKGNEKSASLPIIFENKHVPDQDTEQLADTQGKFTITLADKQLGNSRSEIICTYLDVNK